MTEILIQSALSQSRSAELSTLATSLRERCASTHGDRPKDLALCRECLSELVDGVRNRYFPPPIIITTSSSTEPPPRPPCQEWFAPRRAFLTELDGMLTKLKARRIDPAVVDARIRHERARWYLETVRSVLLRLMVDDPEARKAASEKLEDAPADPISLAAELPSILEKSPVFSTENGARLEEVAEKLATAEGPARIDVLKDAFFGTDLEAEQKYLELLRQGLSMEQVIDRILEERQAAAASRGQIDKLKARLVDLNRGRAGLEKKKEQKKARLVPDELYHLPPCAVCAKVPDTRGYLCCPVCAILVGHMAQEKPVVYCSEHAEKGIQLPHNPQHVCASREECVSLSLDSERPANSYPDSLQFCRECLETHRLPSLWCSSACAAQNFQRHREDVHLPSRAKLNLIVVEKDQLEDLPANTAEGAAKPGEKTRYRARDITAHVISYGEAAREWEEKSHVKME